MFVVDTAALLRTPKVAKATTQPGSPSAARPGFGRLLLSGMAEQARLLARHRSLPRPARYAWAPDRLWRRHSALMCALSGDCGPEAALDSNWGSNRGSSLGATLHSAPSPEHQT